MFIVRTLDIRSSSFMETMNSGSMLWATWPLVTSFFWDVHLFWDDPYPYPSRFPLWLWLRSGTNHPAVADPRASGMIAKQLSARQWVGCPSYPRHVIESRPPVSSGRNGPPVAYPHWPPALKSMGGQCSWLIEQQADKLHQHQYIANHSHINMMVNDRSSINSHFWR